MTVNYLESSSPATSPELDPGIWSRLPPELDPGIWRRLPPELLDNILTFLPLKAFLNLRTTCKHFSALILSPSFISKHSSSSFLSSFLLLSHPHLNHLRLPLYDSALGAWRKLCIPLSLLLPYAAPFSLISTSKGLLCFSLPTSSSLLVCNLLAHSSRKIDFPSRPFSFELLTLVTTPTGYKIFLLSSSGFSFSSAFVYDSRVRSWRRFEGFDPILNSNCCHQEGVWCNGCLYFATSGPFSVVSFDLGSGVWEKLDAEMPSEDLTFVRLVSGGEGNLFMIGGIGKNGISRSMKLWALGEGGGEWVEMEVMPEAMCRKFMCVCYHNYEHVYCLWHQGMVCVCCYTWPEVLYYKVSRRTWHWLPKSPSLPEKWSCGFSWFSFVPQLCAFV